MSTANLSQRAALSKKIEATVQAVFAGRVEFTPEAIANELERDVDELCLTTTQTGIAIGAGPKLAPVIYADLTNHLGETDQQLADRFGLERSTVSRILIRSRRHLGLSPRQPQKRRPHRRTKTQ